MVSPTRPPADVVVFDLGGVLIDWNPRHLYRKLVADEAFIEWFLAEVCSPAWNAEQDAGRSWAEAVAEAKARHPAHAALIEAYADRWPEMIKGDIPESVAVLEDLAARDVPLYALTNWSHETFHHARARFAWLEHFRDILVSGEVGMKKPDARIFRLMLQRIGVEPAAVVFIDDVVDNVESARAIGMQAVHFTSPAALRTAPQLAALLA
ncbi:MAG: HAD family hydrolase [Alphaproteobacteria bacterium]